MVICDIVDCHFVANKLMMYKHEKSIGLVTVASPLNQNLALLDVDEHLSADSLAVIHEGYINVIPILNPSRRSKYVSLSSGDQRGCGIVKEVTKIGIFFILVPYITLGFR